MSMLLAAQVWHYQLPMARSMLLMAICDSAEDDGTGCTASDEYLMWKTGLSRATVYRELRELEKKSIITRMHLADGRREITVHLHNGKPKPDWTRPRRRGRPGSAPIDAVNGSQPDTDILIVGNTVPERDPIPVNGSQPEIIGSHCENNGSHTEIKGSQPDASLFYMIHPSDPSYSPILETHPTRAPTREEKREERQRQNAEPSPQTRRRELWQDVVRILNVTHAQREFYLDPCTLYELAPQRFLLRAKTAEQQRQVDMRWGMAIKIELKHLLRADCTLALDYGAPPHAQQRSISA